MGFLVLICPEGGQLRSREVGLRYHLIVKKMSILNESFILISNLYFMVKFSRSLYLVHFFVPRPDYAKIFSQKQS